MFKKYLDERNEKVYYLIAGFELKKIQLKKVKKL